MPFGKHMGKRLGDLLDEDPAYLDWLSDQEIRNPTLAEAVAHINCKYGDRIEQALGQRRRRW